MTKEEYYKFSEDRKLPLRCPCLSNCARYHFTAYFIGKHYYKCKSDNVENNMKEMGILEGKESISRMLDAGESATFIGGNSSFYITNGCPEFFLHPHNHKPSGMGPVATHQFSYDEFYKDSNKFKAGESRHYTECPEYSLFKSKKIPVNTRKKISFKIKAELQKEINSKCPFCSNEEVGHFEIHHIDENPSNNESKNLLMLCPICHSKITKGDITMNEVILKKDFLKKDGSHINSNKYASKNIFQKQITALLNDLDSAYYLEIKQHWNSYSVIENCQLLSEVLKISIAKSIDYGILPLVVDFVNKHLYHDRDAKYIYNQPHLYMHNSEDEGYDLPLFYHIRFIGIMYSTAIDNKVDIATLSNSRGNMQTIFSGMIEGIVNNLILEGVDSNKEYPTNFHWLIGEIFDTERNWLDKFNESNHFNGNSSYVDFIPYSISLCLSELYKGVRIGKITTKFLASQIYYGILCCYFSSSTNILLRDSIEENIIGDIPKEFIEPIFEFSFDEKFAMQFHSFCEGKFRTINHDENKILTRLRDFLMTKNKI